MHLLLPLTHIEAPLGPGWSRPLGLMPAGNGLVIEQLLFSARKYLDLAAVFLGTGGAEAIAAASGVPYHIVPAGSNLWQTLLNCRELWSAGPVLLALGDAVIDADLGGLENISADATCFVHHPETGEDGATLNVRDDSVVGEGGPWHASGMWWFRNGGTLAAVLHDLAGGAAADLTLGLVARGVSVAARRSDLHVPLTGDKPAAERLLTLNHRLLGFGRSSDDAIERSYGEDFTVLTPVFIDDTATIDRAVVGPYTSVAAGALVRGSVVGNSVIGRNAIVEDAVLDRAVVGEGAVVRGPRWSSWVADEAYRTLGA